MNTFKLHTISSAPAGSAPILDDANKGWGFIPNLYARLAESPAALQGYKQIGHWSSKARSPRRSNRSF